MIVEKGSQIPAFKLQGIDENGEEKQYTNQSFLGKKLVVYFYPKDDTPGCTKESCAFNSLLPTINEKAAIVGVSADDIASHRKFQSKYNLKFPLLSDLDTSFAKSLNAGKGDNAAAEKVKIARSTFLFDEQGCLIKAWYGVKVGGHDQEVLNEINACNN